MTNLSKSTQNSNSPGFKQKAPKLIDKVPVELTMKYLKLPVEIVQYAFQEKKVPQLRLWCYYKLTHPIGFFKKSSQVDTTTMEQLNIKSPKTLTSHKQKLIRWNWIGYDAASQQYFLRSYSRLKLIVGAKSRLCAWLYPEYFRQFRIWCVAGVIGAQLIWSTFLRKARLHERGKRGRLKTGPHPSLPLSNSLIANALGLSIKQASIYKNQAVKAGFLKINRNQYRPLNLCPSDLKILRQLDANSVRKMELRKNRVYERLPDRLYIGQVELTKRRRRGASKKGKHI